MHYVMIYAIYVINRTCSDYDNGTDVMHDDVNAVNMIGMTLC